MVAVMNFEVMNIFAEICLKQQSLCAAILARTGSKHQLLLWKEYELLLGVMSQNGGLKMKFWHRR